jgi:hypothetical protein
MKEALSSSETPVLTRATLRNIPEYTILNNIGSDCNNGVVWEKHSVKQVSEFNNTKDGKIKIKLLGVSETLSRSRLIKLGDGCQATSYISVTQDIFFSSRLPPLPTAQSSVACGIKLQVLNIILNKLKILQE